MTSFSNLPRLPLPPSPFDAIRGAIRDSEAVIKQTSDGIQGLSDDISSLIQSPSAPKHSRSLSKNLPTTRETVDQLRRRLVKQLLQLTWDLTEGARINGQSCDCLQKHGMELEATTEELMTMDTDPAYRTIHDWAVSHQYSAVDVAAHPPEFFQSWLPEVRALRKSLGDTPEATSSPIVISANTQPVEASATPAETTPTTGCVLCALGTLGMVTNQLSEGKVSDALDTLNTLENDLRSEMTADLESWEKALADKILALSKNTKVKLGAARPDLQKIADTIQTARTDIGKEWFKTKLSTLSPEDRAEIEKRIAEKMKDNNE